jgi:hypothetical protein
MWPPHLICCLRIVQLDVQILIHTLQRAPDAHLILQLDGNLVVHQRLEEAEEEHVGNRAQSDAGGDFVAWSDVRSILEIWIGIEGRIGARW